MQADEAADKGSPRQQQQQQQQRPPMLAGMVSPHIDGVSDLAESSRAFLRALLSNPHAPPAVLQAAEAAYRTTAGMGGQRALDADREATAAAANLGKMLDDVLEAGHDESDGSDGSDGGHDGTESRANTGSGKMAAAAGATPGGASWVAGRVVLERLQWESKHRGDAGVKTALATLVAPAVDGLELAVIAAVIAARPVGAGPGGVPDKDAGNVPLGVTITTWLLHHGGDLLWQLAPSLLDKLCASSADVAEVRELMAGGDVDDLFS